MNTTFYTVGVTKTECHGHGDYMEETKIPRIGSYGEEGFPLLFTTHEKALNYYDENKNKFFGKATVVELKLAE